MLGLPAPAPAHSAPARTPTRRAAQLCPTSTRVARDRLVARAKRLTSTVSFLTALAYEAVTDGSRLTFHPAPASGSVLRDASGAEISKKTAAAVKKKLDELIASPTSLSIVNMETVDAVAQLEKTLKADTIGWIRTARNGTVRVIRHGTDGWEPAVADYELNKKVLAFELREFVDGALIMMTPPLAAYESCPEGSAPKMSWPDKLRTDRYYKELVGSHSRLEHALRLSTIGELNSLVGSPAFRELVWIAEGIHDSVIGGIAAKLIEGKPRVVSIAGPSSSGKTTFAKRLSIAIRVLGGSSVYIGMDDYYKNDADVPRNADGSPDYETLESIDYKLLASRVKALAGGSAIPVRHYAFTGPRIHTGYDDVMATIKPRPGQFVIIEGIHGLNPALSEAVGLPMSKIFISPVPHLRLDARHRLSSSDSRLLRRLVRDWKFRGASAVETLSMWSAVRSGEEKWILPYKDHADFFFNTHLVHELPILAVDARPILAHVQDPALRPEAYRLLNLIDCVFPVSDDIVLGTSLLREFIGGSNWA